MIDDIIEDVTQSMVERLAERLPEFTVDHFPDGGARYQFTAHHQALFASYERSTYEAPDTLYPLAATQRAEFGVTICVRSLKGKAGAASTIARVRSALFGWRPTKADEANVQKPLGFAPFVPTRDELVGEDQGTWRFVVLFASSTTIVAETDIPTGPALKGVTLKDST